MRTYTGGTTVNAGTLMLASATALAPGSTLTLNASANAIIADSPHGSSMVLQLGALNLAGSPGAWIADLNLTNNKLIIETTDATQSDVLATLQDQVLYGSSNPDGITTDGHNPLLFIDNASLAIPLTTFGGVPVDLDSIIITPALLGDANLDGSVDVSDLNIVLSNLGTINSNWTSGNFDGAPTIDLTDLNDVLNNFGTSLTNGDALHQSTTPTPEPASLCTLCISMLVLRRRAFRNP
jgi:hypothetical protein